MPTTETPLVETALPTDSGKNAPASGSRYTTAHVHLQVRQDLVRTATLDGKAYIVAPVVPITEGVHNGEFISFEEIATFPDAWDGRPLPIDHPADVNGLPVTANSPDVIEKQVIGQLFDVVARPDIRGISGNLWVDIEKAKRVPGGAAVLQRLQEGGQLEVSTGYFTFVDDVSGEFDGIPFNGSQRDVRPDHLALLPEAVGACNWEMGCGAPRLNQEKAIMPDPKETSTETGTDLGAVLQAMLAAQSNGEAISQELVASFNSILSADADTATVRDAPSVLDADPETPSADNGDSQALETNEETADTATEEAEVVHNDDKQPCGPCQKTLKSRVQEIVNSMLASLNIGQQKEETNSMTIDERVDALVSNEATKFSEDHREWLKGLTEEQLELIEPAQAEATEVVEAEASTVTPEVGEPEAEVTATTEEEPQAVAATLSQDDIVKALEAIGLSTDVIAHVNASVEASRANRDAQVEALAANSSCPFSKEQLAAMSDEVFETARAAYASDEPAYFVRPGSKKVDNVDDNVPPAPPAVLLAKAETN